MDSLLKISEVAAALRCSKSYAYFLAKSGAVDTIRIGRKLLVKRSSLDAAIESGLPFANIADSRP